MAKESTSPQSEQRESVHPLIELQEAHRRANWNWAREVQLALSDSNAQSQKAQAEFAQKLQEQWRSATDYNQFVESYRNQLKKLQEQSSNDDLNKRLLEAHRNYFRAIQKAWSQLDADSITFG